MKIFVALFALVAVASAGIVTPSVYGLGLAAPLATSYAASPLAYAASPLAYSAHPVAYSAHPVDYPAHTFAYSAQPIAYSAHVAAPVAVAAPAIQSGYVAATRGSIHTAPLPEGPFAASHHINTAPAPGTY